MLGKFFIIKFGIKNYCYTLLKIKIVENLVKWGKGSDFIYIFIFHRDVKYPGDASCKFSAILSNLKSILCC